MTSPLSGRLTIACTATSKNQPVGFSAKSPDPQAINIIKTDQTNVPSRTNIQIQNHLNQQSLDSSENQQSATCGEQSRTISNQQLIQSPFSQDKITDPLKKPDTPKTDLQNANPISQIARDPTTPESNANVTNSPNAKTAFESAHNLTSANHDPAGAIREQISQSVTAAAQQLNRQITIQLNPPELGKVSVKFSQAGSELTGLIEASNPRTRADINQQIPEILRSLEQAGVSVKRIDVTLSDLPGRSNHDSHRDNSSQFNWDRSAGNTFNDSPRQQSSSDYLTTSSHYSAYEPRIHISDGLAVAGTATTSSALNVLI
jgi:flagellar hook-length control protein FliK